MKPKERPILFSGPMVRAVLDGRKTQTRRPINPQPGTRNDGTPIHFGDEGTFLKCPYGQPGDRLWVRETWMIGTMLGMHKGQERPIAIYRADGEIKMPWRPSIHMPRWASRITLEINRVRVERVQDIAPEDCRSEGIEVPRCGCEVCSTGLAICTADAGVYIESFRDLWQSIYGNWDANPWVWAVEFRRTK